MKLNLLFFGRDILKDEPYKLLIRGKKNVKCMQNKWIMFRAEKQVSDLIKCELEAPFSIQLY